MGHHGSADGDSSESRNDLEHLEPLICAHLRQSEHQSLVISADERGLAVYRSLATHRTATRRTTEMTDEAERADAVTGQIKTSHLWALQNQPV
jgi:hypothetical protein